MVVPINHYIKSLIKLDIGHPKHLTEIEAEQPELRRALSDPKLSMSAKTCALAVLQKLDKKKLVK